jgi:choline dehydrogenase-like flavoprotein
VTWFVEPKGDVMERAQVVVVGSGAGGALAALTFAEAGLDVVVLEEGHHIPPAAFASSLPSAMARYYAEGGMRAMEGTPPIPLPGGRGLGGSTLVNSAICFRTPDRILALWNEQTDGAFADEEAFRSTQSAVERLVQVGLTPDSLLSGNDRAHKRAAVRLGWRENNLRRNTPTCVGCARCNHGCPSGGKASVDRVALPRAAAAGARIYAGCRVDTLTPGSVSGPIVDAAGAHVGSMSVDATAVVLACGSVGTPRLLLDSGLVSRCGEVGRGLRIHPVVSVLGFAPDSIAARGATQGHCVEEFDHDEMILESNPTLPGGPFQALPLVGRELQAVLAQADHLVSSGALIRDVSEGQVLPAMAAAASRVSYELGEVDRDRLVRGLRRGAQLWLEGLGCAWVAPAVWGAPVCRSMDEVLRAVPLDLDPGRIQAYSSHPQASCGIGRALDHAGQVQELPGVYVADASALPSNVGRNPQISVMTVARVLSERIALRLGGAVVPL